MKTSIGDKNVHIFGDTSKVVSKTPGVEIGNSFASAIVKKGIAVIWLLMIQT